MKITNLTTETLEFNDLGSHIKGVSLVIRDIKLSAGASKYLVETGEVLLSAQEGDIKRFVAAGKLSINDTVAVGATLTAVHNFNYIPTVSVSKVSGANFVPALAADYTATTNAALTTTVVVNLAGVALKVRLS